MKERFMPMLTIDLPPELEERLRGEAERRGLALL